MCAFQFDGWQRERERSNHQQKKKKTKQRSVGQISYSYVYSSIDKIDSEKIEETETRIIIGIQKLERHIYLLELVWMGMKLCRVFYEVSFCIHNMFIAKQ